jgi:hypothetical protein
MSGFFFYIILVPHLFTTHSNKKRAISALLLYTYVMKIYKYAFSLSVTNILLLGAVLYAFWTGRNELGFVTSLMFLISISPHYFKAMHDVHLPPVFIYGAICFIFSSIMLGQFGGMYDRFHWYDAFLHFLSALVLGMVGFLIIYVFYSVNKLKLPLFIVVLFSFSFAASIGVVWEIIEYFIDMTLGTNMQVSSLDDTMIDLIVNSLGALIAAVIGYLYVSKISLPTLEAVVETISTEVVEENTDMASATEHIEPEQR